MPLIARVSKSVWLILSGCLIISLVFLPFIYPSLIITCFSVYCFYDSYDKKLKGYARTLFKPWLQSQQGKRNQTRDSFEDKPGFISSKNKGTQRDSALNNVNSPLFNRSENTESLYHRSRMQKSVQTAAGPLLFHEEDSFNDSLRDFNSSIMFDTSLNGKYTDNRRKYSVGRGFLGDNTRVLASATRQYPTHQYNYVFLGQFPTVHLNKIGSPTKSLDLNTTLQNRVTVKLAPPRTLTPSQRLSFAVSLSPTKISPTNLKLLKANPCDTKTVLAALKDSSRKRARKEKDTVTENESKRRRQESDSDSSDSSVMITTDSLNRPDTNTVHSEILMKTLQGKRPATPLSFYNSSIQSASKRLKNDTITISYSSSRKSYKLDTLPQKRQAQNFSPSQGASKVQKFKDRSESHETEIDLAEDEDKEIDAFESGDDSRICKSNEVSKTNGESPISSPVRKEGQSHKRNLLCYSDLGKNLSNVYHVPQYVPTLDDCEEHKKIEQERVRNLLGSPPPKASISTSLNTIEASTKTTTMPSSSFSIPENSSFQVLTSAIDVPLQTTTPFSFANATISESNQTSSITSTSSTTTAMPSLLHFSSNNAAFGSSSTSGFFSSPTTTAAPKSATQDMSPDIQSGETPDTNTTIAETVVSQPVLNSEPGTVFSTSIPSTTKEPTKIPNPVVLISSNAEQTFTEAFKFPSNPSVSSDTQPKSTATLVTTSFSKGFNMPTVSTLNPNPSPNTSESTLQPVSSPFNMAFGGESMKNTSSAFPTLPNITSTNPAASSTNTTFSLSTSNPNSVFGSSANTDTLKSLFGGSTVTSNNFQSTLPQVANNNVTEKPNAGVPASNNLPFAFGATATSQLANSIPNAFQLSTVASPQATLANPAPSSFQFSGVTAPSTNSMSTPFQFSSSASTQASTSQTSTPFQFSSVSSLQPSVKPQMQTPFQFSSQVAQPVSSSSNNDVFTFLAKPSEYGTIKKPPQAVGYLQPPSTFFNPQPSTIAFGSSTGALPSYSEAMNGGNVLGQSNNQNQTSNANSTGMFGSSSSSNVFSQSHTPNFSFGAQPAPTPVSISNPFNSSQTPFTSTPNNTFGTMSNNQPLNFNIGANTSLAPTNIFGSSDSAKTTNNYQFNSPPTNPPNVAFGAPQASAPGFQFGLSAKNFNFGSVPTSEPTAFGASQPQPNQPYFFGGAPGVPNVDPSNAAPGSQLFSIGSGIQREKKSVSTRRRLMRK